MPWTPCLIEIIHQILPRHVWGVNILHGRALHTTNQMNESKVGVAKRKILPYHRPLALPPPTPSRLPPQVVSIRNGPVRHTPSNVSWLGTSWLIPDGHHIPLYPCLSPCLSKPRFGLTPMPCYSTQPVKMAHEFFAVYSSRCQASFHSMNRCIQFFFYIEHHWYATNGNKTGWRT